MYWYNSGFGARATFGEDFSRCVGVITLVVIIVYVHLVDCSGSRLMIIWYVSCNRFTKIMVMMCMSKVFVIKDDVVKCW